MKPTPEQLKQIEQLAERKYGTNPIAEYKPKENAIYKQGMTDLFDLLADINNAFLLMVFDRWLNDGWSVDQCKQQILSNLKIKSYKEAQI